MAGVVALFLDEHGVVGLTTDGSEVRVLDHQEADRIILDPVYGVLWLKRAWSHTSERGLFITDLRDEDLSVERFGIFEGRFSLVREGDPSPIPTDDLLTPGVHTILLSSDMSAVKILGERNCSECQPAQTAIDVLHSAWAKGRLPHELTLTSADVFSMEAEHANCTTCGRKVSLNNVGATVISVEFRHHPGQIGWQVYDDEKNEFISALTGRRAQEPWGEAEFATYVMACAGNRAIVVDSLLLGPDLVRVDSREFRKYGQCLEGGSLFLPKAIP
ncbi:hypothetical protein ACNOYE_32745 [Nannocystaceae bacterium ST9]